MSESEKKGFFAKIFGGSKSSCCNMRIEEVPEEGIEKQDEQRPASRSGRANAVSNDAIQSGSDSTNNRKEK